MCRRFWYSDNIFARRICCEEVYYSYWKLISFVWYSNLWETGSMLSKGAGMRLFSWIILSLLIASVVITSVGACGEDDCRPTFGGNCRCCPRAEMSQCFYWTIAMMNETRRILIVETQFEKDFCLFAINWSSSQSECYSGQRVDKCVDKKSKKNPKTNPIVFSAVALFDDLLILRTFWINTRHWNP